jgi:hypothetical protein
MRTIPTPRIFLDPVRGTGVYRCVIAHDDWFNEWLSMATFTEAEGKTQIAAFKKYWATEKKAIETGTKPQHQIMKVLEQHGKVYKRQHVADTASLPL